MRSVVEDVTLGKILIQTNPETSEPEVSPAHTCMHLCIHTHTHTHVRRQLHYFKLSRDIRERHVLLMDASVASGAAAMMAVRVLLDHAVPEDRIILVALILAPEGVRSIAYAFPKVKIIASAKDREVNSDFHILPGIGTPHTHTHVHTHTHTHMHIHR